MEIPAFLLVFAFIAGTLALLSPCAFPMLPTYVSYFLRMKEAQQRKMYLAVSRGIAFGAITTLGFLSVFVALGYLFSIGGRVIIPLLPMTSIGIGMSLVVLGGLMLSNVNLPLSFSPRVPGSVQVQMTRQRGLLSFYTYGVVYALVSMSCTMPVFLVMTIGALTVGSLTGVLVVFLMYTAGMGSLMIAVSVAVATSKALMLRYMMKALPYLRRFSAIAFVGAGGYLLYLYLTPEFALLTTP